MKKAMLLTIFLLMFVMLSTKARADTYISGCSDLDIEEETYYLTDDVYTNTSSCFRFWNLGITLDCQNHLIVSNNSGLAIDSNENSITVKNCVIANWSVGIGNLIHDSQLINITFINTSLSIRLAISDFDYCRIYLENVTRNGLPVAFYNTSVNLINEEYGDLILCNVDDSNLNNVSGQIISYFTDYSNFTNIKSYNNYYGIYFYDSSNNKVIDSIFLDNNYDINIYFSYIFYSYLGDEGCNNYFENVTGSGYRPIKYFNYSVNLSNEVLSELILCNADYSNITNVTVEGSDSIQNNQILLLYSEYVNFYKVKSVGNYHGLNIHRLSKNIVVNDSEFINNVYGIFVFSPSAENIIVTGSKFVENTLYQIYDMTPYYYVNTYYNNLFNSSNNQFYFSEPQNFNVTKQLGERIYSYGSYIGGNYWTNPEGNGYSDICTDSDRDGFCDEPYYVYSDVYDYLPLSNIIECNDGEYRCNNNNVEVCIDGQWVFYQECEYGCYEGECISKPFYNVITSLVLSLIPLIISISFILIPLRKILTEGITAENIIAVALAIIIGLAFLVIIINSIS